MNITVGGDLDVTQGARTGRSSCSGQIDTVRGTYQFQGRRFDLVRGGTLRFTGEAEDQPAARLTATREIPTPASRRGPDHRHA